MKLLPLLAASLACAALARAESSQPASVPFLAKSRIIVNGFRMPSIGLEYQRKAFSWHAGMYPTVVSKDDQGENENTWFGRTGMTWWLDPYVFLDASYLYGFNHNYRNDHAFMLNPGLQYTLKETLMFRLGVSVLASPDHVLRINPTPGIGLSFVL